MTGGNKTYYARWRMTAVELELRIVNTTGNAAIGTVAVTSPNPTAPPPTQTITNHGDTKDVLVDNNVDIAVTLAANINRDWFRVDIEFRNTAGTVIAPPAPLTAANVADIFGTGAPSATPLTQTRTFEMPGNDIVVYVRFTPRDAKGFTLNGANVFYGVHPARLTSSLPITLQQAFTNNAALGGGVTNPAGVSITVFHHGVGANWELTVESSGPIIGSDEFARMLVVGAQDIFGTSTLVSSGAPSAQPQTINWNSLASGGVAVVISPASLALTQAGTQTAVLTWTLETVP